MAPWPSSLRARLTLWYTVLLGLPLIAFAILCYVVFARSMLGRVDGFIDDALTAFSREVVAERRTGLTAEQALRTTVDEVRFPDLHIAILDTAGREVAASAPGDRAARASERQRTLQRPLVVDGRSFSLAGTYALADVDAMLARIRRIFLIAIPLLLLSAATGGYFLAKRNLAPVAAMAARAAEISATSLHERLPVSGGDELVGLSRVVNELLDRIERSFAQQRRFAADASHELRTPTAILRAEADVTLSREHRTEEEYRASVTVMRDATQRIARIVDDLFLLARADSGHLEARRQAVYLEDLVHEAARAVRAVADRRAVHIELGQLVESPFRGDADLLGRLLLNLLDNAIRHSPDGASVGIAMARRDGDYAITVTDAGPGIPAEARERVFERFYRLDPARSRAEAGTTSGAGLGLAIARRIAELHAGRLEISESRPGRTEFRLTLPADDA